MSAFTLFAVSVFGPIKRVQSQSSKNVLVTKRFTVLIFHFKIRRFSLFPEHYKFDKNDR